MMPAYSRTTLHKKLGLNPNNVAIVYNFPGDYFGALEVESSEYKLPKRPHKESVQFIHLFASSQKELYKCISKYKPLLTKEGMMWVGWPKGTSGINTDLKRGFIREALLQAGW